MSIDQLTRDLNGHAAARHDLSIDELAAFRREQIELLPKSKKVSEHDIRKAHFVIGIGHALGAKRYLLGLTESETFHLEFAPLATFYEEFVPGQPCKGETRNAHQVQLTAFEQLLGKAFKREIEYDEFTGVYQPIEANNGRQIFRSSIDLGEERIVRFSDAHTNMLMTSAAGKAALTTVAEA